MQSCKIRGTARVGPQFHPLVSPGTVVCLQLQGYMRIVTDEHYQSPLKVLSHEIDFKNVDEKRQILALIRAAAGF